MWVSILKNEKASVTQHKYKLHITHCKVAKKKQSLSSRATWALPECSIRALTVTPRLRNTSSFGPVSAPKTAFHWYKWEFQKIGKKIAFYGTIGRKKVSRSHRLWRCIFMQSWSLRVIAYLASIRNDQKWRKVMHFMQSWSFRVIVYLASIRNDRKWRKVMCFHAKERTAARLGGPRPT